MFERFEFSFTAQPPFFGVGGNKDDLKEAEGISHLGALRTLIGGPNRLHSTHPPLHLCGKSWY